MPLVGPARQQHEPPAAACRSCRTRGSTGNSGCGEGRGGPFGEVHDHPLDDIDVAAVAGAASASCPVPRYLTPAQFDFKRFVAGEGAACIGGRRRNDETIASAPVQEEAEPEPQQLLPQTRLLLPCPRNGLVVCRVLPLLRLPPPLLLQRLEKLGRREIARPCAGTNRRLRGAGVVWMGGGDLAMLSLLW